MVKQCPKCPLRFDLAPMLADHLTNDHGVDPDTLASLQPESFRIGMVRPGRRGVEEQPEQ